MTRVAWGAYGTRVFETGVDRGVLYMSDGAGVPWNGLTSVSEASSGGAVQERYIDGVKYLQYMQAEEFTATVEAFTYPVEFGKCDGTAPVKNGLYLTQQKRSQFGFSYRTKLGNDVDGTEHAYKIHLVYNALAAPSNRARTTMTSEAQPVNFSWSITTRPPVISGYKPTSHVIIDSRETPLLLMTQIEDILYGNSDFAPRMPALSELINLFDDFVLPTIYDGGGADSSADIFDGGGVNAVSNIINGGGADTF